MWTMCFIERDFQIQQKQVTDHEFTFSYIYTSRETLHRPNLDCGLPNCYQKRDDMRIYRIGMRRVGRAKR